MEQHTKLPALAHTGRIRKSKDNREAVWTSARIKQTADRIVLYDNSNLRMATLAFLYEFGILTEQTLFRLVAERIAISSNPASFHRRLYEYERDGLITTASRDVIRRAHRAGLPESDQGNLRAYRLGPVGIEVATFKFSSELNIPLSSNTTTEDYLTHDLLCAEAMLKMPAMWLALGQSKDERWKKSVGLVEVRGPHTISIWNTDDQKALVSPDGLLIKRDMNGCYLHSYIVEYHNNNARLHVANKLDKYEKLSRSEYDWIWQTWGLTEMPMILVLHRQDATREHYQEEIKNRRAVNATYTAISLADVWAGKLHIIPLRKQVMNHSR